MQRNISIRIDRITILHTSGPDYIIFRLALPERYSPFPAMKYPASFKMETAGGYAEEWLKETWGLEADDIVSSKGSL